MEDGTSVIAPRGWRCFGRYGFNGSTLTVAPTMEAWALHEGKSRDAGPAVIRSTSFGPTSDGFAVARRGDYEALLTTLAKAIGTGTSRHLAPGPLPIDGIAILAADQDHGLDTMDARLPAAIRPLVANIIKQMEREVGADNRHLGK